MSRKDSHKIDNSTFRALAAEARRRLPTRLVDVCMALSKVTETMLADGTPISYKIANRMGEEIKTYLCS